MCQWWSQRHRAPFRRLVSLPHPQYRLQLTPCPSLLSSWLHSPPQSSSPLPSSPAADAGNSGGTGRGKRKTRGMGSLSFCLSFYSMTHSFFLSTERWRPRHSLLFRQSSCLIDSTQTPCTSGFPCCWTQSCWPSSTLEIISNMFEILEREPLDGFSKLGKRGGWSRSKKLSKVK